MNTSPPRRQFLSICTGGLIAVLGGVILTPVLAFVTSPLRKRAGYTAIGDDFVDAGAIDAIPAGKWTLLPIEIVRQDGWVKTRQSRSIWVRCDGTAQNDVHVLSPICTHLGCPVAWFADESKFRCPCHGGTFDADGAHISGPPPRGMDPLPFQVKDGHLWVRWQDFRISVPDRVPVQV